MNGIDLLLIVLAVALVATTERYLVWLRDDRRRRLRRLRERRLSEGGRP